MRVALVRGRRGPRRRRLLLLFLLLLLRRVDLDVDLVAQLSLAAVAAVLDLDGVDDAARLLPRVDLRLERLDPPDEQLPLPPHGLDAALFRYGTEAEAAVQLLLLLLLLLLLQKGLLAVVDQIVYGGLQVRSWD